MSVVVCLFVYVSRLTCGCGCLLSVGTTSVCILSGTPGHCKGHFPNDSTHFCLLFCLKFETRALCSVLLFWLGFSVATIINWCLLCIVPRTVAAH